MSPPAGEATLTAVLHVPEWTGVRVLAGLTDDAGARQLTGVVIVPAAEVPEAAIAGRLLVVLHEVDRTDWRLDVLVRRARAAGVAALVLPGTEPVGWATAALADRVGLPVLGSPAPLEAGLAARRLLGRTGEVQARQVLRTVAACRRAGRTVEDLAREVTRVLRRPVALLDRSGHVTVGDVPGADRAALAAALGSRNPAEDARLPLPSGVVVLAAPVVVPGGETAAWAAATLPEAPAAEEAAVAAALAVAAVGFGHRLAVRRLTSERDARSRTSLLGELLNAGGAASAATRRRAVAAGWPLEGWHTAVRIAAQREVDTVGLRGEVVAALAAQDVRAVVVESGDGWSAWTTTTHEPGAADVQAHSAKLRRSQRDLAVVVETQVGVGRPHPGLAGLTRSLAEAADACRLAASRPHTGRFVQVDQLGLAQLLLAWTRTDTFQPAARSLLQPLEDQPGDLLHTLGVYLDAESSVAETAAVLGVHRNTVAGRMARIQQLLAVDLADAEQRLALHLACRTMGVAADREAPQDG
ncbi:CdaR family transcriptional regulator [Geodermatophilus sp. DSM 44513]|uniref:PucR family transcriptional regulator n=1 Tax=Geodermatophilus sp. DSM 44513 TaxID=1528104 RepID=UPI00127E24D5|nr:helix-turn-helix domain-containing protein [Geodermatophilus sp. DSM 44513]WNV77794.1 helix-turn-helix domain-containing protein [Geodermatophilus sp. DSM 44513]